MINFVESFSVMMSSARSMAVVPTLNMDAPSESRFLMVMLLQVAAHPVWSLSLEPSV